MDVPSTPIDRRTYLLLSGAGAATLAGCSEEATEISVPANFEIAEVSAPPNATVGERVTIAANVTNRGDEAGNTTVRLVSGDTELGTRRVDLSGNESTTVEFTHQVNESGRWSVQVDTGDDRERADLDVETDAEAAFSLGELQVPESPTAGQTFVFNAPVENAGDAAGVTNVTVSVGNQTLEPSQVALEAGEETTASFSTSVPKAGNVTIEATVGEQTTSAELPVEEPEEATFEIDSIDAPSSVLRIDAADVSATITNTGEVAGESPVTFTQGEDIVAGDNVEIEPGASVTSTATLEFDSVGDKTIGVEVADDSASTTITVEEPDPALFNLSDLSVPDERTESVTVRASVRVANNGQLEATKQVELRVDGEAVDSMGMQLEPNQFGTAELTWGPSDPGTYEITMATPDDTASSSIVILDAQPADGAVDQAREMLIQETTTLIQNTDSELVGNISSTNNSQWSDVKPALETIADKLDEAENALEDYDGDAEALQSRIDTLRSAREAIYAFGATTGHVGATTTLVHIVENRLGNDPDVGDLSEIRTRINQGQRGLSGARTDHDTAESRLGALDSDWLSSFNGEIGVSTTVSEAVSSLGEMFPEIESRLESAWGDVASIELNHAAGNLASATQTAQTEVEAEFLTEPRSGVSVSLSSYDSDLASASSSLDRAGSDLSNGGLAGGSLGSDHDALSSVEGALQALGESLTSGASGFNNVSDGVGLITIDAYEEAFTAVDQGVSDLARARRYYDRARNRFGNLSSGWQSSRAEGLSADTVGSVLDRYGQALDGADQLATGIDKLLDIENPVKLGNQAYENENYAEAADHFREAESIASEAESMLSETKSSVPVELDLLIEEGLCRASHIRQALEMLAEAGDMAANDNIEDAEAKGEEALEVANTTCP